MSAPKKCLSIVPGYTTPSTQKSSETFTRPKTPDAPAAGKAGGKPENDPAKCVYCTLCAKKCPQGRPYGGPDSQKLAAGPGQVCRMRHLCRLLPEKVPDAEINL